jgi:enoyl-CoA hydratase
VLRVEQHGPVRWLILNRPNRRNAINDELISALLHQAESVDEDPATSVVVIAGEGPSFCAGGDFQHFLSVDQEGKIMDFLSRISACLTRIESSPKPWVAAVHGHAIAGGLEIALVCDVVIAAADTLIGDGHINNGLIPGAGSSVRLERAIGKGWARWLHLSGELQLAQDLLPTGWIREVVPFDELRARAQKVAEQLASQNSQVQQSFKQLLNAQAALGANLQRELDAFEANWVQNDVPSALRAFLAQRGSDKRKDGNS